MAIFPENLERKLQRRSEENAFRRLSRVDLVDFSSNDYLGFAKEGTIGERAMELLTSFGCQGNGATGSRLLSGNHELYDALEAKLCAFHKAEAALVFNSGYDANVGFFSSVPQRGDLVFYDEYCHASIRDGIQLGRAKAFKFKHNDIESLGRKLDQFQQNISDGAKSGQRIPSEIYVVTESVFSMDGDAPDIASLAEFCQKSGCHLVVDEAHALGVFGRGMVREKGLEEEVFATIVTFGKGLGTHGAAILGSGKLRDYLINFARSLIYTTGLSPYSVASILAGYETLGNVEGKRAMDRLQRRIHLFKDLLLESGLKDCFLDSDSAIQVCKVPGNHAVKELAMTLHGEGFDVRPILSPTVPKGEERLRFCIHAFNSEMEIGEVLTAVERAMV